MTGYGVFTQSELAALPSRRVAAHRRVITFDQFFHGDTYPIGSTSDYQIYQPLTGGRKVEAMVIDLNLAFFINPPIRFPAPLFGIYADNLRISAPRAANVTHTGLYVMTLDAMTVSYSAFDASNNPLGNATLGALPRLTLFKMGFSPPTFELELYDSGGNRTPLAILRLEGAT